MNKWITLMVMCLALSAPAVARAHEGHMHKALGTVSAVAGQHVTIKTTDGKTMMVMLDKETTVTRGKDKLTADAIKVGERVSVDYMEEKNMMMAHAVKLGSTATESKK